MWNKAFWQEAVSIYKRLFHRASNAGNIPSSDELAWRLDRHSYATYHLLWRFMPRFTERAVTVGDDGQLMTVPILGFGVQETWGRAGASEVFSFAITQGRAIKISGGVGESMFGSLVKSLQDIARELCNLRKSQETRDVALRSACSTQAVLEAYAHYLGKEVDWEWNGNFLRGEVIEIGVQATWKLDHENNPVGNTPVPFAVTSSGHMRLPLHPCALEWPKTESGAQQ